MSKDHLPILDKSIEDVHLWLNALMRHLDGRDRVQAFHVLKAVLHALRDRIGPENAVHFSAQLPLLIRGLFFEGWKMSAPASHERHVADFLEHVACSLDENHRGNLEGAVRAVFAVIWERVDQGEVAKLMRILPADIRALWQSPAVSARMTRG
ncbi:DUF2267 domain-containing protein [Dongia sp.]|uniref:DUF2267 domain-containing protein n=1 Tax=Dongia sp. TaxID=1977262 RepID=UPI0035B14427